MRVLFVTAEAYPLAKTGGLADVSRALPLALARRGVDVRLLLPGYPRAYTRIEKPRIVAKLDPMLGIDDATLVSGLFPDVELPVWLIDSPTLFRRDGGLYQDHSGKDWPDNALRFAFLAHAAARLALQRTRIDWKPDIVHANDWHAGLLPLLLSLEKGPKPSTVFTTHNMAFQGNFAADVLPSIGVPESCHTTDGTEFYGQISFLKAGLSYGDRVTTVSPTYAREILTPDFGCGMDGVLRHRGAEFSGILNGIDDALWDPASDIHLPQTYRASDISGKRTCKATLQHELGLPVAPETPLIGFVSRLTHQKMADTILSAIPWIAEQSAQLVVVGEGDPAIEAAMSKIRAKYPHQVSVTIGYDEPLAHRLQAGSDILLAPARFEPCGLTQLYALRYGTLPVVRRTGGLADTVVDADATAIANRSATGFMFDDTTMRGLITALGRALTLYQEPLTWRRLQLHAMAQDFSWDASAAKYVDLYSAVSGIPHTPIDRNVRGKDEIPETARQIAR
ncbi:MAG: glycogen synthase GlgA [Alphaproteobacteria bacterium]|nr:glycogen synthase GlgA [Alphaproteobacteria bacterium]MDE2111264.1 glycogen synthase GlgA [Alphaproteobacteria bacterium]MDE2492560.1 glycogen synthase GlgA [Alphaproteobacteria bacterium]